MANSLAVKIAIIRSVNEYLDAYHTVVPFRMVVARNKALQAWNKLTTNEQKNFGKLSTKQYAEVVRLFEKQVGGEDIPNIEAALRQLQRLEV